MKEILKLIVRNKKLHAEWLNSLSYLEYTGFRKMVKSFTSAEINSSLLLHMNEESRHAYYLKRLSIKIGGNEYNTYDENKLLCAKETKNYFYTLDHELKDYLIVTWAVEKRAVELYECYQDVLTEEKLPMTFKPILVEEEKHLNDIELEIAKKFDSWTTRSSEILHFENQCFTKYWTAIEKQVNSL